jgi:hypothetical protein
LLYENLSEMTSALQIFAFATNNLVVQGLINGTFKLVSV